MFRTTKNTLFCLLFGIVIQTQIAVSQDFSRFGAPFAGTPFAGAPFGRGPQFGPQFGTQFRGFDGPPQFGGGPQFGGPGIGGAPGGFNGGGIDGGSSNMGEGGLGQLIQAITRGIGGNLGAQGGAGGFPAGAANLGGGQFGGTNGLAGLGRAGMPTRFEGTQAGFGGLGGANANNRFMQQRRRLATSRQGAATSRTSPRAIGGLSQDPLPFFVDPTTGQQVRVLNNNAASNVLTRRSNPAVTRVGTNVRRGALGRATTADANQVVRTGASARRMTSAIAARRRAMAASRARAVPGAIPQTFEQAVASFNNVFNPVPPTLSNLFANAENMTEVSQALGLPVRIPPTTTTTTTPRPPESVNWLGLNHPMQRQAAPQTFNQGSAFQNNRLFQQQRTATNRNAVPDRRRTQAFQTDANRQIQAQAEFRGGNIRQAVPTFQSFPSRGTQSTGNRNPQGQQFPDFNSNDRQSMPSSFSRNSRPADRRTQRFQEIAVEQQTLPPVTIFSRTSQQMGREIRPVQRFRDINTADQEMPRMRAIPTADSNAQIREFRRQVDRRNRERLRNAEMFRSDTSSRSFTDRNSNSRFNTRPDQSVDAIRPDRSRSNMLPDFEPQTRRRTFESDNMLAFNDRQVQQFPASNTGTAPLDLSTMPRDLGQRPRSVMHTRTGADGTREIVIDIAPDTSTTTDWSLVNEFLSNNRDFSPATSMQNFDLSQSVPQVDNNRFQQNDFTSSSTRDSSDRFNVRSSAPDTGQRRAAPIELNQLSRGLDWGVVDDFMQQRQSRQGQGRGRQASAAAAAAAAASSGANNRLPSIGGSLPGEALTFNSVNPSQFAFSSDRNVLNTVESDPNSMGSFGFTGTARMGQQGRRTGRRPVFAIVPLTPEASMVDIQNFVEELATSINRGDPRSMAANRNAMPGPMPPMNMAGTTPMPA